MKLPNSQREQFKKPLGLLLPDAQANKENVQKHVPENSYVITVGDRTTQKMTDFGMVPSLQIIDGLEKRKKKTVPPKAHGVALDFAVDNPPAEITSQSVDIIKKIFSMRKTARLVVNGEEDLLVLPVCVYAPENSVVLYGQPNEGLVIVKITPEIRNKTQLLLDSME